MYPPTRDQPRNADTVFTIKCGGEILSELRIGRSGIRHDGDERNVVAQVRDDRVGVGMGFCAAFDDSGRRRGQRDGRRAVDGRRRREGDAAAGSPGRHRPSPHSERSIRSSGRPGATAACTVPPAPEPDQPCAELPSTKGWASAPHCGGSAVQLDAKPPVGDGRHRSGAIGDFVTIRQVFTDPVDPRGVHRRARRTSEGAVDGGPDGAPQDTTANGDHCKHRGDPHSLLIPQRTLRKTAQPFVSAARCNRYQANNERRPSCLKNGV